MGFLDDILKASGGNNDSSGGYDSAPSSSGSDYDIDYDQLDRNDSWSPNLDPQKGAQRYNQYQQAYQNYQNAQNNWDTYSGYYTDTSSYDQGKADLDRARQSYQQAEQDWKSYVNNPLVPDYNPNYKSSDPNPNKPYEYDYQYMSPDELRQMDANDAMSPNWSMGKTWQQADEENYQQRLAADDGGVLRKAGASKYLANPDISEDELKSNLAKPFNWLADTAKNAWNGFVDGLTPTHVDVDSDTKRDYANRLIDYIEQGYGTEDIKKAAAGDAQFLDWLDFIKPFEASGDSKAAMTKTFDDIVAYDMKTGANALGYKSIGDAREGYQRNKDKNKDYDKVESVERMKTEDPEMYEKYSKMSPAQQAIYRVLQSAKGGLAGLGNAMANFVAKGGSEVSKAAENAMFSLNTTPAQSAVYIIANGGLPKKGILQNGQVSEFTQEQWDNMAPSDKARLEKFYGIDSLAEFNKTLRELNYNIGVSSTFNEYYESKRDEVVEATKPIREYANVKAYEASYGLNGVAKLGVELIPSAIGMAFDAVVGGLPAMGMRVFGDAYSRAVDKGVDDQRATLYALASTAVEVGTELIGGESVVNAAVYKNKGIFNSGAEAIIGSIDNTTMQRIALAAIGGLEEGLEEDMSQLCEPLVEALLETDFFQAVKEGYGEQRAADYAWAALGGALMSIAGAPVTDVITSISNRAAEAKGNFTPMNIDGTTRESNPNGRAAYSQSSLQIAQINQNKAVSGNPLAMAAYEQSIKGGASEDEARSAATYVHDSTSTLTPEQKKTYANDQDKFNADVDAFQEHRDEFKNAEVGDVVLDINNNEVGTVTKADDNGITVELTNADGEKTTEEVKFVGNNGVLDADSDLAKALGKEGEGAIVNAEEAKIFAQEAAARRKAQEEAKAAAAKAAKPTDDSGTGTVKAAQPKADNPAPKPQPQPAGANMTPEQRLSSLKNSYNMLLNTGASKATLDSVQSEITALEQQIADAKAKEQENAPKGLPNPKANDLGILADDELSSRQQQVEEYLAFLKRWGHENTAEGQSAQQALDAIKAEMDKRKSSGEKNAEEKAPAAPKKRTYQDILKDIENINKQIAEAEDPAVRNGLISKRAELWKERNATPEHQEELRKYEEELREKQQKEQEEEAAKRKEAADKKKAEDAEFEKTLEGLSEEEKDKKRRERRAEQQYQSTTNEDRKALDKQKYEQHKEQIESLKNGDVLYNQYGDPIAKVTTKGNGRYVFTMLQSDGTETTTFGYAYNGHFDGGTWTTLWQEFDDGLTTTKPASSPIADRNDSAKTVQDFIDSTKKDGAFKEFEINGVKYKVVYDAKKQSYTLRAKTTKKDGTESKNYHVLPGTNALSAEGLLNYVSKLNPSQKPSESPVSASPETGKYVPTQTRESADKANETLNTGLESEVKSKAQKPLSRDDELALLDGGSTENTRNNKPERTTSVGSTDYVTDSDTRAVNNLNNSKETYKLGDERYTADDVAKMSGGDVLNRLKAWAKALKLGGLRNFSTNLAQVIAGNKDYQGKNPQVEKSFSEVRGENGKVKNDFTNRTNLDRAAYEESFTQEALNKEREDSFYLYLQEVDPDTSLSDIINGIVNQKAKDQRQAAEFILRRMFERKGIDVNTATAQDAINALAPVTVEQALNSEDSQLSKEDREELTALLERANDIEVRFGNGKYNTLIDILNGTVELTTSNDSNFSEGDFHGETVYGEQIAAIQEDIASLREELSDLQKLGNLGEENRQRVANIENQIQSLEDRMARLSESEEAVENTSDQTVRNPLTENDYESVLAEDDKRDATAAKERNNKPELGSVSKDNESFIAESDVPAEHKKKGATGNFGRVRGIDVDGTIYYALVSKKNGAYRHIMPDSMVARAKNIFSRLNAAIKQKQRAVEYYRSVGVDQNPYAKGTDEYNEREKELANFNKNFNDLLDLQEKLDKISNGRYTFKDLWNDKSMPSDLRKAIAGEAEFENYNIESVAEAVLESDAIRSINAMKGAANDRSGTQNTQLAGRGNPLVPGAKSRGGFGTTGRVQNQSNGVPQGRVSTLGYDGQTRPNESRRDAKQRVVREAKDRARTLANEANSFLKSEGSVLGAFAAMQRRGYSGRVYNNGNMAVITSGVKTIAHDRDQQSSLLSRILNKVRNNDTEAYMVDSVTIITQSGAVELGGITIFQNGKALVYASTEQGLLHESNHDDWERASDYIVNNNLAKDPIKWLDNRLAMICRTAGVDYNALKRLAGSQYSNDVVEEVYCELASLLYDNDSASFFDGSNGNYFTEAADKLRNNTAFARLVDTIDQYSDEQATLNYVENAEDQGRRVGEHIAFQKDFGSDDISPMDDESFQNLIDQENAYNNAALGEGNPIDQSDMDSLVNEASADEIDLLNSRGSNVSAEDTGRFNNLVDQASASEEETLNDLRNDSEDITNASEGAFNNLVDTENESIENALNEAAESSANQYPERRFKDAKDYYGKAYDEVVSKVATRHARNNSRSSFTHEDIYNKLYGNTPNARQNFRRLQKLNTNIDSLLKGKMSAQAFNAFIKNMMDEQGIGQIVNDDIQKEFSELAKLEEKATGGDQRESDVINFQYAAADAVAHLCARMDMVEKTERARAKLDSLAKEHGKTNKKAIGNALDWYNRMQITGDNFWRMAGNWDTASRNQGYALAQEHNKAIATRISEEAKLKDYFSGIDKNSKQFRDFANGTTMSNVDFEGHKISLMEAVKFVKICDTMRAFANENRRPDWQRVAALGGFAFEGKDGKPVFVDIQGSKKNGGAERVQWVQDHYDAAMAEIQANKAASEYMKACEEMYWDASQTAEKVHSKVNGYERYMYGKGKYTDIHYASKDGAVDFSYKDRDAIDVHDTGIMQKRTRVNGGYVICNPMSRSIDAYISQISNYIAFEEFGQKLGVLNDSKSINGNYANTVGDAYGSQYSKWFDNYVKSMTLYRETDPTKLKDKALAKARQAMMSGALVGSVSVPIKQVSSFFDTIGMVDPMAVAKAFGKNPLGLKQKGINNYLYKSRGQSISDPDFAELFGKNGLLGKIGNNPVIKLAKSATNMMDEKAVSNVYMACVYDTEMNTLTADKLYKNGKNFNDGLTTEGQFYVDSKFEQVLLGTQPIFTPQARNELARTDNQWLRMLQTFRTQQTQNYNRMLQTWNEYQAADGSTKGEAFNKFAQTMGGQVLASASLAALTAIANGVLHKHRRYKDDDDELDEEKFGKKFLYGMVESMTGNALFAGDITKWAIDAYNKRTSGNWDWRYSSKEGQYFSLYNRGINVPILSSGAVGTALQVISSAINLYDDVQKNGWDDTNILSARYLAGNMTTALGVPANNVYNALNAGYQWYNDLAYKITGDKKYEHKYDDFITQYIKVDNNQQNRLVNAILSNNTDKIDDMFENMGQDKFANTVYYGALDRYKSGKIDRDEYIDMLVDYGGKTYKDAVKDVDKKINLIESGISQYNGIDGRDGRKAFYDQYSDNFKSKDAFKQFFTDVKDGKAEGKHHSYYTTWNGQQQEVTANQCSIIDRMNENMAAGNFDYDTAKLLWENYYGYSTYKSGAWQYVGKW